MPPSRSSCCFHVATAATGAFSFCPVTSCTKLELPQGCLRPVEIKIPENSILWPSPEAAVVGGNVLTSQRVTDVILKCFEAAAASQVHTGLCSGNSHEPDRPLRQNIKNYKSEWHCRFKA
jgi:N-methylhydantoinase B/oxoprolinase/acetone carboxylase alpha subunit